LDCPWGGRRRAVRRGIDRLRAGSGRNVPCHGWASPLRRSCTPALGHP
jgi:hypothetical protein